MKIPNPFRLFERKPSPVLDIAHVRSEVKRCKRCRCEVDAFRRYADGSIQCIPCAGKKR